MTQQQQQQQQQQTSSNSYSMGQQQHEQQLQKGCHAPGVSALAVKRGRQGSWLMLLLLVPGPAAAAAAAAAAAVAAAGWGRCVAWQQHVLLLLRLRKEAVCLLVEALAAVVAVAAGAAAPAAAAAAARTGDTAASNAAPRSLPSQSHSLGLELLTSSFSSSQQQQQQLLRAVTAATAAAEATPSITTLCPCVCAVGGVSTAAAAQQQQRELRQFASAQRHAPGAAAAGLGPSGMEGTAASPPRGGSAFPVFLGSPENNSVSSIPQVRIHAVSSTEHQQQRERTRERERGEAHGATSFFTAADIERSSPEQQHQQHQQQQQQQQQEGVARSRRGPPTEEERLRVREKYRERLKERKLQIYRRALEEVVQREKEGAQTRLAFKLQLPTRFGENLFLVGSEACVGSWSLDRAIPMLWGEGNVWSLVLALPNGVRRLEYKYVIKEGHRTTWEPGANHTWEARSSSGCSRPGVSPAAGPITVSDSWGAGSG
ncbi:hypothetical protein ACSSS7_005855 [Eimeria intestinalis]